LIQLFSFFKLPFRFKASVKPAFDHDHAAPALCQTKQTISSAPFLEKFPGYPLFFISTTRLNIPEILG